MMDNEDVRPIDAAIQRLKTTYTPGQGRPREDIDDQPLQTPAVEEHAVAPAEEMSWPPPGLEKIHGALPRLTADFALGVLVLVLPIVWLGFVANDPRDAGGFGALAVLAVDFIIMVAAYARLRQLLLYAYIAITQGYPRPLVWHVAADRHRDMQLLLHGKGVYTGISKGEIARIAGLRVTSAALALFGVLWIPLTLPAIAVVGFLGATGDATLWLALLTPAVLLLAASIYLRFQEASERRTFHSHDVVERETQAQVAAWSQFYAALGLQRARSKTTIELRLAMGAVWLAAFILLVPLALTVITTAIPRYMAGMVTSYTSQRISTLHGLQPYRATTDSSITDMAAGEALQNIRSIGYTAASPLLRPPTQSYAPVFDRTRFDRATNPEFWPDSLFMWIAQRRMSAEQRRLADGAAAHPANAELSVLAQARSIDIPNTRWQLDIADSVAFMNFPIGYSRSLRDVALAYVAEAGVLYDGGRSAAAEAKLKEIIAAGFLLRDEALLMMDAGDGVSLLRIGGRALASLYEQIGRRADASAIRAGMHVSDAARFEPSPRIRSLDAAYRIVLMRSHLRAARWETFAALQTAAPCMSLYAGIFGPTEEHKKWVEAARNALVRTPGEAAFFRVLEKGMVAKTLRADARCTPRILRTFRPIVTGY